MLGEFSWASAIILERIESGSLLVLCGGGKTCAWKLPQRYANMWARNRYFDMYGIEIVRLFEKFSSDFRNGWIQEFSDIKRWHYLRQSLYPLLSCFLSACLSISHFTYPFSWADCILRDRSRGRISPIPTSWLIAQRKMVVQSHWLSQSWLLQILYNISQNLDPPDSFASLPTTCPRWLFPIDFHRLASPWTGYVSLCCFLAGLNTSSDCPQPFVCLFCLFLQVKEMPMGMGRTAFELKCSTWWIQAS